MSTTMLKKVFLLFLFATSLQALPVAEDTRISNDLIERTHDPLSIAHRSPHLPSELLIERSDEQFPSAILKRQGGILSATGLMGQTSDDNLGTQAEASNGLRGPKMKRQNGLLVPEEMVSYTGSNNMAAAQQVSDGISGARMKRQDGFLGAEALAGQSAADGMATAGQFSDGIGGAKTRRQDGLVGADSPENLVRQAVADHENALDAIGAAKGKRQDSLLGADSPENLTRQAEADHAPTAQNELDAIGGAGKVKRQYGGLIGAEALAGQTASDNMATAQGFSNGIGGAKMKRQEEGLDAAEALNQNETWDETTTIAQESEDRVGEGGRNEGGGWKRQDDGVEGAEELGEQEAEGEEQLSQGWSDGVGERKLKRQIGLEEPEGLLWQTAGDEMGAAGQVSDGIRGA